MTQEQYDSIITLFSNSGFKIVDYPLGKKGYLNLGHNSWLEFMAFKTTREIEMDICTPKKEINQIPIHTIKEIEFIFNQFNLNKKEFKWIDKQAWDLRQGNENKDIQHGENQT